MLKDLVDAVIQLARALDVLYRVEIGENVGITGGAQLLWWPIVVSPRLSTTVNV